MLKEKLDKILAKKKSLPDNEKKAKMDVVKGLSDDMAAHMHKRMGPHAVKKVSVASDSPEGLKAGLDMAKQVATDPSAEPAMHEGGSVPEGHDAMEEPDKEGEKYMDAEVEGSPAEEASESPEEEASEDDNEFQGLDMQELDEKLQKLMELKKKMEHSK